jgi:hypothetical protein
MKIAHELKERNCCHRVLGSFDFLNSEDRSSRAKVDLVWIGIELPERFGRGYGRQTDPFRSWFQSTFSISEEQAQESKHAQDKKQREHLEQEVESALTSGESLIPRLVQLYDRDMQQLLQNYRSVEQLDAGILKELGVSLDGLVRGLKDKIAGLYWNELFSNLDKVTDRLTSKSRKTLLSTLYEHVHVDFTEDNAYAVVLWVIKNANDYFDQQLVEIYKHFASPENVRNYVSNQRIYNDKWRFNSDASHYQLDYRVVWKTYGTFVGDNWRENVNGLCQSAADALQDLCTIAKNLGFHVADRVRDFRWEPGALATFDYRDGRTFMEVRAYKNGNVHIKLDQAFMRAWNIEAARILKWVRSAEEAAREMEMPLDEVQRHFNRNLRLLVSDVRMLTNEQEAAG